eukprot:scaffold5364_cov64-Isochrysis_galbana.AAC.2
MPSGRVENRRQVSEMIVPPPVQVGYFGPGAALEVELGGGDAQANQAGEQGLVEAGIPEGGGVEAGG